MQAAEIGGHHGSHHDVVEMRDDEVCVMEVHIGRERSQEQSGQAADREQTDEPEGVEHRCVEADEAADAAWPAN